MTRPTLPADGDTNWGDVLRTAINAVSDKADAGGIADGGVTNVKVATGISADKLIDGTTNHVFTAADDIKLATVVLNMGGFARVWGRTAAQGLPVPGTEAADGDWCVMDVS